MSCSWRRPPPASACFRRVCSSSQLQGASGLMLLPRVGCKPCCCARITREQTHGVTAQGTGHQKSRACPAANLNHHVLCLRPPAIVALLCRRHGAIRWLGTVCTLQWQLMQVLFDHGNHWEYGRRRCRRWGGARPSTPPAMATAEARASLLRCSGARSAYAT